MTRSVRPDDEQIVEAIRDAINESPVIPRGSEPYVGWSADLAYDVATAVAPFLEAARVEGEARLRERLLSDEAVEATFDIVGYVTPRAIRNVFAAALDAVAAPLIDHRDLDYRGGGLMGRRHRPAEETKG